jgi:hypothetical protein
MDAGNPVSSPENLLGYVTDYGLVAGAGKKIWLIP